MKKAIREIMEHHELSCLVVLDMVEVGCCSTEAGVQDDEIPAVKLADLVYSQPCNCEQSCMSVSARGDAATKNGSSSQQEFDIMVCIKVIKDQSLLSKTSSRINKVCSALLQDGDIINYSPVLLSPAGKPLSPQVATLEMF